MCIEHGRSVERVERLLDELRKERDKLYALGEIILHLGGKPTS